VLVNSLGQINNENTPITMRVSLRICRGICLLGVLILAGTVRGEHLLIPQDYDTISESRLTEGVGFADKFRRELIRRGVSGQSRANVIARACLVFREKVAAGSDDVVSLKKFKISEKLIVRALEGDSRARRGNRTFDSFAGRWYGKWDKLVVDHHWYPSVKFSPRMKINGFHDLYVETGQFAWVGDGYGWNIVASTGIKEKKLFVLGSVYHVEDGDPERVREHRPHVGVICGENRLIWITRGEIFFEEKSESDRTHPERYTITGFRYQFDGLKLQSRENAFQAIYTRNSEKRPDWKKFWVGFVVN
jgi:hypothetical protein